MRWPYKLRWKDGTWSRLPFVQGAVRNVVRLWENLYIRLAPLPKRGINSADRRNEKIIVSLTSFPARIHAAYYAVKSLMLQTVKPDGILLWLSESQFPERRLPSGFTRLEERGLQVKWVSEDLRSHKKYYYALQQQRPGELVITYDDDLIYEPKSIERLVAMHTRFPRNVICNRATLMRRDEAGQLDCDDFSGIYTDEGVGRPSSQIVPSTGAGCLYPYGVMPESTFDKEDIVNKALTADDIWIWHNCNRAGVGIVKTHKDSRVLCEVYGSQREALVKGNIAGGGNHEALRRLKEK